MAHTIDTRGLSCPQPLLLVNELLKDNTQKSLTVLVDNEASKENITRAALKQGWQITYSEEDNDVTQLELTR